MKKRFYLFAALLGITLPMMAAIELNKSNPTYEQNFDGTATAEVLAVDEAAIAAAADGKRSVSLSVALPDGWKVRTSTNGTSNIGVYSTGAATTTYVGGTSLPSNAKNGTWNFGKIGDTDRAVGGITSSTSGGALCVNVLCQVTNTDAEAITSLDLSYAIEQYRQGKKNYKMTLYTSTTGEGSSWTAIDDAFSLIFDNTVGTATGAADALLPISTKSVEAKKLAVNIASGASLYLAWNLAAADGAEVGGSAALALDNITIKANYGETTPEPEPEPVVPIASGELFGTYQAHNAQLYKNDDMTDPQQIGVDFYIATCGQTMMMRAISTGETNFGGAGWETQLRVETGGRREIQACTIVSNKNHYTGSGCNFSNQLATKAEDLTIHFFVNGSYPAGVGGGYRKTTDFAFNRYSINNPIADAVAPVLDVENTTFVDNGDGTITVTFGDVTADDEYFYYVADKDHNLGDISLDNTITLTKPTVEDGTTYTLRAYAVDFNGNKSAAKEYEIVMPFDENLNLARSGKASAGYWENSTYSPEKANDGDAETRWNSWGVSEGNNWWMVKLQNAYVITSIKANYRDVSGTCLYEGSMDGTNWFTMASDASLSNGIQTYPIDNLSAQYIRFSASRYATVNEFEVYGSGLAAQDATAPTIVSLSEVSSTINSATLELIAYDKDDNGDDADIQSIKVSDVANGLAEQTVVLDGNNQFTISDLKFNTTYTFHVVVADKAGNQTSKDIEVVLPFNTGLNLAENKPSEAGVHQNDNVASRANDGNTNNFWTCYGTGTSDQWWWSVDLENLYQVNHIYILYNDHAGTYTLNYSADGIVWHEYQSGFKAQQVDAKYVNDFTAPVVARYFKFVSTVANVGIREFEVYATGFAGADGTAPEIETFEATATTTNSVTLHIVATDKDDNEEIQPAPALTISDLANGLAEQAVVLDGDNKVVISGLKSNKTYNFLLTATDLAGNTTNDNLEVELPYDTDFDWTKYATEETVWAGYSNAGDTPIKAVQEGGHWGSYGITGENDEEKKAKNWWAIDLGAINEIRQITIDFEAERKYNIEYSFDDKAAADAGTATWLTAMANVAAGDADILNPNFAARMIRIHAQSASNMGINRIHIKGSGWATTDAVAPQVTVTEVEAQKQTNSVVLHIVATDEDDAHVAHPVKSITISGDNDFTTIENAVLDGEGNITLENLKDNATYNFHVTVTDRVGLTAEQDIEVRVAFNTTTNLALASNGATAEAGANEAGHEPEDAIDGSATSYWGTYKNGGRDNWEEANTMTITLAASYNINKIVINVGGTQGAGQILRLEYLDKDENWVVFENNLAAADASTIALPVVVSAQKLRLIGTKNNMISIKEFEVYGSSYDDGDDVAPEITSATLVSAGEESAEVSVVATDNVGVFGLQVVDGANDFNVEFDYIHGQNVTLVGLAPGTTYHFSIYALDRAGNVSEPKALEITTTSNPNVPHTAAPTPTIAEARVISIFSNTYSPAIKEMKQWKAFNSNIEYSAKVIAGNDYAYYVAHSDGEFALGYKWEAKSGFTDGEHTGVNVASRAYIHLDVWALADGSINVCLNDAQVGSATLVAGQWNSIDLPISAINLSIRQNLEWMKFTNIQGKTLAIDNIYFYGVAINQDVDNSATLSAYDGQTECAVLNRSFKADGYYYTLCLPFDMSADQIAEAFGDCEISEMKESELRGTLIHVNFDYTDHIVAGQPYIFLPKEDIKAPLAIDGVTIKNVASTTNHTGYIDFIGFLNPTVFEVNESQLFLGSSDILHPMAADQQETPGLRAYFQLNSSAPQGARAKVVLGPQVTTDIENQNGETMHGEPQKLFIDGQLYIIRAEKMYNVQGQIVK